VAVICVACGVAGYLNNKKTQKTFGPLTAACEGRPVPGARAYVPGPGVHRVVGASLSGGTWSISNSRIPDAQRPEGVADTEVVACLGEETQTMLGTCEVYRTRYGIRVPGTTRTFSRSQRYLPVRLVAAATGQPITMGSVPGPVPTACNSSYGNPTATTFQGGSVSSTQLGPWLSSVLASGGAGMVPMNAF
jgi:hypothetical protein